MPSAADLELLDGLSRDELIERARSLGAQRPEVMTRVELRDEIVRLTETDPTVRRRSRGWLGVARDLVASVMDSGLNLPGAAQAIRGAPRPENEWHGPPPVATLTLAEIYLAQGPRERALGVLEEVLRAEPDHQAALELRARLAGTAPPTETPAPDAPPSPLEAADGSRPVAPPPEPVAPPVDPAPPPPLSTACALSIQAERIVARYELGREVEGATLRVACFVPRADGAERVESDELIDGLTRRGGLSLPLPAPNAVVRAVLGVGSGEEFRPVAVAWVYDSRAFVSGLSFRAPGPEPVALKAELANGVPEKSRGVASAAAG